jgi:serine/threonine kinase PknH
MTDAPNDLSAALPGGRDLHAVLHDDGALTPARSVAVVRQVAAALDALHDAGIAHGDVRPEYILLADDDTVSLTEVGIASAAAGVADGASDARAYAAPERAGDVTATRAADVYSLACVLHECLTGTAPFRAPSVDMLITAHLIDPPPAPSHARPGIPPAFDDVVATGMAKLADERYDSAGALAQAAETALGETATAAPPEPVVEPVEQPPVVTAFTAPDPGPSQPPEPAETAAAQRSSQWVRWLVAGIVVLAVVGGLVWFLLR